MKRSKDFEQFYNSFFVEICDFNVDIADYAAVARLVGEEKEEAEHLLIEAIYSAKDHSVYGIGSYVKGLGRLHSDSAADFLSQILSQTTGLLRLHTAEAIWRTNHSPAAEKIMIELVRPRPVETYERVTDCFAEQNSRASAAFALRQLSDDESQFALLEALDDESPGVRGCAAESLIERHHCRTPELKKIYEEERKMRLTPIEERDMAEGIRSLDFKTKDYARKQIVHFINAARIPEQKIPGFQISFYSENPDYVIYEEDCRKYWFHLWRAKGWLSLFTKDYLDAPNGSPVPLDDIGSFRIVPRIHGFLTGNDQYPHLHEEPHPSEKLARMPNTMKKPFGWRTMSSH